MENLRIINCSKKFVKNEQEIIALKNIDYNFRSNKFYAIMGESGAGKSTLINIISGLLKMDDGIIELDSSEIKSKDFSLIRNKKMGLVYQSFLLNDNLTALENVMLPLFLNKKLKYKQKKDMAINALTNLGLKDRLNHYPKELSGGEQQRVAIARALINDPDIILADEPTGNLDKKNEKYIFNLFRQLANNGKCVIVVSHNEAIKEYADTVLVLKEGVLLENKK